MIDTIKNFFDEISTQNDICKLDFKGLVAFIDPIRKDAKDAIKECNKAGINVIMITGDHPLTALSIAKEILEGNIDIKPAYYKKNKVDTCKYCEYKSICGFNPKVHEYLYIENKSKEEILELIKKTEKKTEHQTTFSKF